MTPPAPVPILPEVSVSDSRQVGFIAQARIPPRRRAPTSGIQGSLKASGPAGSGMCVAVNLVWEGSS